MEKILVLMFTWPIFYRKWKSETVFSKNPHIILQTLNGLCRTHWTTQFFPFLVSITVSHFKNVSCWLKGFCCWGTLPSLCVLCQHHESFLTFVDKLLRSANSPTLSEEFLIFGPFTHPPEFPKDKKIGMKNIIRYSKVNRHIFAAVSYEHSCKLLPG